ncbi:hypothetical protein Aduo_018170 [Ancylostoma duodenale]
MSRTLYRYHDFDYGYGCTTTIADLADDDEMTPVIPDLVDDDYDDDVEETTDTDEASDTYEELTRRVEVR